MKKLQFYFAALLLLFASATIAQQHVSLDADKHMGKHIMVNAPNIVWTNGPGSLPPGSKMAILEGDLSAPGPFTARLILPANYKIKPHFHPAVEHVTVIEGSFFMGAGKEYNEATATEIKAGGFAVMPVGYAHFAFTKEATTIQLHGVGPWGITYINEADDPRKKK
ncbi:MAG TPA: cupin domain-containing protein [Flavisolibacter sp.]|nr:cupin domain-containing protein [Flavisolibacter sp.]